MTEYERFIKIHIGTPHEYVIKDINNNETYGMFKGDDKAVIQLLKTINELNKENEELKERVKQLQIDNTVIKKRYDTLIHEQLQNKAPIWFTQELKLTNKQAEKFAETIKKDLKERRLENE